MNKREADTILLANKKHGISLTMRKEGDVYVVTFVNRIDIKSFEAAKLITNRLVIEGRNKAEVKAKENLNQRVANPKMNFSKLPTRKKRPGSGIGWGERRLDDVRTRYKGAQLVSNMLNYILILFPSASYVRGV